MSIYTRRGDEGQTDIIGKRVLKTDKKICVMGAVSQVYSNIEAAIVFLKDDDALLKVDLERIFKILLSCCHDLASDGCDSCKITNKHVEFLEKRIDEYEKQLEPLSGFIRIGLCESSAFLNIAMTMTRWAEREAVDLFYENKNINININKNILKFLNRLSDYLFCAARYINKNKGLKEALN